MTDKKAAEPIIDWEPSPGCLLVKVLKREELAELYNRSSSNSLSMPDHMGKVSDSVGAGRVLKMGGEIIATTLIQLHSLIAEGKMTKAVADNVLEESKLVPQLEVGDYVAFMPYSDLIIEIDGKKYSLVQYSSIRAVRKGGR